MLQSHHYMQDAPLWEKSKLFAKCLGYNKYEAWFHPLVENVAKKNRSHFSIAVLWPPWSAVVKQLHICFFGLPSEIVGIGGGGINIPLERSWKSKFLKLQSQKKKRKICSRLMTANQGGQKNRNGKATMIFFHNVFYLWLCLKRGNTTTDLGRRPFTASLLQSHHLMQGTSLRQKWGVCRLQWFNSHGWMEVY
jgi:hypothetical protein